MRNIKSVGINRITGILSTIEWFTRFESFVTGFVKDIVLKD